MKPIITITATILLIATTAVYADRGSCVDRPGYDWTGKELVKRYYDNICLVIAGKDSEGLPNLYLLSEHRSYAPASAYVAWYLATDGKFEFPLTHTQIDKAIKYYLRAQAQIKLAYASGALTSESVPTPELNTYWPSWINEGVMELTAIKWVPHLFMLKYDLGLTGSYRQRLKLPATETETKPTYDNYSTQTRDSLNKIIRYAGECAGLRREKRFERTQLVGPVTSPYEQAFPIFEYKAVTEECRRLENLANTLIPLEDQRQGILRQPNCQELNEEENCPEYFDTHREINDLINEQMETRSELWYFDIE